MKRILALVTAPLLVSAAFSGAALSDNHESGVSAGADAQVEGSAGAGTSGADAGAGADADIGADVSSGGGDDATGLDTGTTASTGGEANFGSVISAIQASGSATGEIEAVSDASQIEIVRVSDIAQGESMNALDEALSRNQADVDNLRSAIEANATVSQRLEEEQVAAEDVVAAESSADGSLTIYVR